MRCFVQDLNKVFESVMQMKQRVEMIKRDRIRLLQFIIFIVFYGIPGVFTDIHKT